MPNLHQFLLLLPFLFYHSSPSTSSPTFLTYPVLGVDDPAPSDERQPEFCNDTSIPFPFGVPNFSTLPPLPGFHITCTQTNNSVQTSPPRLSLSTPFFSGDLPVLDFSLPNASLRVSLPPATWRCGRGFADQPTQLPDLRGSPFTYSPTRNVFAVIGCDSMVSLCPQGGNSTRSCVSFCESEESVVDGFCSGVGCCQAAIPERLKGFEIGFRSIRNMVGSRVDNGTCGMAFVLEREEFRFSAEDLRFGEYSRLPRTVVLDWAIGERSCEEAKGNVCGEKADCHNSSGGVGYLCRCRDGFGGNPYVKNGCQGAHILFE